MVIYKLLNRFIISKAFPPLNIIFVIFTLNLTACRSSAGCQLLVNLYVHYSKYNSASKFQVATSFLYETMDSQPV